MFLAAVLYVFSQTVFLQNLKDQITALTVMLFVLGVISSLSTNTHSRRFLIRPYFLISSTLIILFLILNLNLDNLDILIKIPVLLLATALFVSAGGLASIERYADGALLSVLLISILANLQIIQSVEFSAHEMWIKKSAGFFNPNNAPYFVYISALIYFICARPKKMFVALGVLIFLFYSSVYSRTYLALGTFLMLATICDLKFPRLMRPFHIVLSLIALTAMIVGIYFYLGITMYPEVLSDYSGTPLDIITSYRVTVALDAAAYNANSIFGMSVSKLDSLYVELIYSCGPAFLLMFFMTFIRNLFAFKLNSTVLRIHIGVAAALIAGLFEIQLFNITPVGPMILFYGLSNIRLNKVFPTTIRDTPRKFNENFLLHQRTAQSS